MSTDRIEKRILVGAPRERVWRALTTTKEFGAWFGANLSGAFTAGATVKGPITLKNYEHVIFEATVERVEPGRHIAWRWHPYAIEEGVDYSSEPTTLVEFTLEDAPGGTLLTVVESGFDSIPIGRRAAAFRANDGGWAQQLKNIDNHVRAAA